MSLKLIKEWNYNRDYRQSAKPRIFSGIMCCFLGFWVLFLLQRIPISISFLSGLLNSLETLANTPAPKRHVIPRPPPFEIRV